MHVKTAYIFPGQGSQYLGMGKDIYDNFEIASFAFYRANRVLHREFEKIIFGNISDKFFDGVSHVDDFGIKRGVKTHLDRQVQITTYITSWACFSAFKEKLKIEGFELAPELTIGHSFGEYTALTAADVINFDTGLQLVNQRENIMISCAKDIDGALIAVVNKKRNITQEDVINITNYGGREILYIALYNASKQFVFGGVSKNINAAKQLLKGSEFRTADLPVLGPWHTPLMNNAKERLKNYIEGEGFSFREAKIPIIANTLTDDGTDPKIISHPSEIKDELINQMDHPVLWCQTIKKLIEQYKIKRIFIFGPGKITQKIISNEYPDITVLRVEDLATLEDVVQEIKQPGSRKESPEQGNKS